MSIAACNCSRARAVYCRRRRYITICPFCHIFWWLACQAGTLDRCILICINLWLAGNQLRYAASFAAANNFQVRIQVLSLGPEKTGKNGHACYVYGCSCWPIWRGSCMLCQLFETHHSFTSLHVACRLGLDTQPAYFLEDFLQLFVFFSCGCYCLRLACPCQLDGHAFTLLGQV